VETITCARCATTVDVDDVDETPPGWSFETERGRVLRYCRECLRENIRSIEAKLPEEYW
jgi:hypothetical protein